MKLIILDRDGVINQDNINFIKNPNEWIPIPDSLESIARLNQHGFNVIIATNQSGIGRGLFDIETMNAINKKMLDLLGVLNVYVTKYRVLHDPASLRRHGPMTVEASCVDLPVAPDCIMCDRNVHDPTTLRDVCVLPQTMFLL